MRLGLAFVFFIALTVTPAATQSSDAQNENGNNNGPRHSHRPAVYGFVVCSGHDESVPTYFKPSENHPVGALSCGETIRVMSRNGDMVRIRLENGLGRYVPSSAISQRSDQTVPFGDDSGVPDGGVADCTQPPKPNVIPPHAIYSPPPEFSDEARRKEIQGAVRLSLTVGTDGRAHNVKVEKGLGYGLDEKAVEAVGRWKFEPALKDGQPCEQQIAVDVSFKLY